MDDIAAFSSFTLFVPFGFERPTSNVSSLSLSYLYAGYQIISMDQNSPLEFYTEALLLEKNSYTT